MMRGSGQIFYCLLSVIASGENVFSMWIILCLSVWYLQRSGTVKTVPYGIFYNESPTTEQSVGWDALIPPRRNLAGCTLYFATPLNPICRGRCSSSARRVTCTFHRPPTAHYPLLTLHLFHDAHAAISPIVRVMCPSGAASATNNTPGRAVPAAMRSARACSTARLTLRRSSRAP